MRFLRSGNIYFMHHSFLLSDIFFEDEFFINASYSLYRGKNGDLPFFTGARIMG
jgi:hypothetical protein